jgi:hypothetical protein
MCHGYQYVDPILEDGAWTVRGWVTRSKPEGHEAGPGSWHHWAAQADDRYTVSLAPVASDSTFWSRGCAEIHDLSVICGGDTVRLQVSPRPVRATNASDSTLGGSTQEGLVCETNLFDSTAFHLSVPVPDMLEFNFRVDVMLFGERKAIRSIWVHAIARADRHRRWHLADLAES